MSLIIYHVQSKEESCFVCQGYRQQTTGSSSLLIALLIISSHLFMSLGAAPHPGYQLQDCFLFHCDTISQSIKLTISSCHLVQVWNRDRQFSLSNAECQCEGHPIRKDQNLLTTTRLMRCTYDWLKDAQNVM